MAKIDLSQLGAVKTVELGAGKIDPSLGGRGAKAWGNVVAGVIEKGNQLYQQHEQKRQALEDKNTALEFSMQYDREATEFRNRLSEENIPEREWVSKFDEFNQQMKSRLETAGFTKQARILAKGSVEAKASKFGMSIARDASLQTVRNRRNIAEMMIKTDIDSGVDPVEAVRQNLTGVVSDAEVEARSALEKGKIERSRLENPFWASDGTRLGDLEAVTINLDLLEKGIHPSQKYVKPEDLWKYKRNMRIQKNEAILAFAKEFDAKSFDEKGNRRVITQETASKWLDEVQGENKWMNKEDRATILNLVAKAGSVQVDAKTYSKLLGRIYKLNDVSWQSTDEEISKYNDERLKTMAEVLSLVDGDRKSKLMQLLTKQTMEDPDTLLPSKNGAGAVIKPDEDLKRLINIQEKVGKTYMKYRKPESSGYFSGSYEDYKKLVTAYNKKHLTDGSKKSNVSKGGWELVKNYHIARREAYNAGVDEALGIIVSNLMQDPKWATMTYEQKKEMFETYINMPEVVSKVGRIPWTRANEVREEAIERNPLLKELLERTEGL